ncbi:sodium-coupled monocarboxylate transporter 2-like [Pecten maximus]|uniref:sodium-coupled monocarboxylate transporter 2-like n=1 Tax=Pecten maximus TaxID=6579 RepID=UPI0014587F33|nr:sodium-coupled monocarboxylate transporter 2-like [Pecten maximus]
MTEGEGSGLVLVDYITFGSTILISISIGVYFALAGGKQKTTNEYLLGNRHMKALPVALSLMVTFESSITMLGFPAEVYVHGIMYWWSLTSFLFANLIGVLIWVPLIHPLKVTSVYQYLELRYKSRSMRLLGTCVSGLGTIFYMGSVLYGPAIALDAVTEFPLWASVAMVASVSVLYTAIGGIKAVIWTDVFQCLVMLIGMFSVIIQGTINAGGSAKMFEIGADNGRLNFFNFDPDPFVRHTFWSLVVGSSIQMTGMIYRQSSVQRISSMPTQQSAKRVLLFAGPAFLFTMSLAAFEGLIAFAYFYVKGCDPLASKQIDNPNQVMPFMVLDIFRNLPGMSGLFLASLFSASLSTLSSGLASLSAQLTEDFIKPNFKGLTDIKTTIVAKISVLVFGMAAVAVSFMIINIEGPITQVSHCIQAAFTAPLTGLMFYSAYFPTATKKGAIAGVISSMSFIFWISMGQSFSTTLKKTPYLPPGPTDQCQAFGGNTTGLLNSTYLYNTTYFYSSTETSTAMPSEFSGFNENEGINRLYAISYQWLGTLGIIIFLVIGSLVSYVTGRPDPADVDVRYILPIVDHVFPFLPKRFRTWCYGGAPFEKRQELLERMNKGVMEEEVTFLRSMDAEHLINGKQSKDEKSPNIQLYLELRYKSRGIRLLGTCVAGLGTIFYLGSVLYGPAIALDAVTELPVWSSIVLVASVSVLYTSIGGLKAVIWTDVFQCLVMLIGMLSVITKGTITSGGSAKLFEIVSKNERLNFFNFDPDPFVRHTFWSLVIGSSIRMTGIVFNQSSVQRISSMPTQRAASRVLLLAGPAFLFTMSLAAFEGIIAFAYFYSKGCDPLASKQITNPNQVIPFMVLDIFKNLPGMSGLFMASLFSASLSTLSSGLASLSAQLTEDFIKPTFKGLSDFKITLIAKLSVIVFGMAAVAVSFMIVNIEGPIYQVASSIMAAFSAPMTGLMLYSAYFTTATKKGAVAGVVSSMSFIFWISMGQSFSTTLKKTPYLPPGPTDQCPAFGVNTTGLLNSTYALNNTYFYASTEPSATTQSVFSGFNENEGLDRMYAISYQWLGTLGIATFLVVASLVSYVTGRPDPAEVDVRYILPIVDHVFPFLPKRFRTWCYGGAPFERRQQLLDNMDKGIMDHEVTFLSNMDTENTLNEKN